MCQSNQLGLAVAASKKKDPNQQAGSANAQCVKKLIEAHWNPTEAMCGDQVSLVATAVNFAANTAAKGKVTKKENSQLVANLKTTGQNTFTMAWTVKDVVFPDLAPPLKIDLKGEVSAEGQTAATATLLAVKRIPDKDFEAVSFHITTGNFAWDMKFKVAFKRGLLVTRIKMQFKKAWLGKWVEFDPVADAPATGWAFVKQVPPDWQYWDGSGWVDLPRAINSYDLKEMFFEKSGTDYKEIGGAHQWPEAFSDITDADLSTKKTFWLKKIQDTWDQKFKLHRMTCPSSDTKCCTWTMRIWAESAEASPDQVVYATWAQDPAERSDAKHWYIADTDAGTAPHEFGHLLGAYDEYTGGALDPTGGAGGTPGPIDDDTIMGQNLPLTAKERHLKNWCKEVKKKLQSWTTRNAWDFEVKPVDESSAFRRRNP